MRPPCTVVVPFAGTDDQLERARRALSGLQLRQGDELVIADNRPGGNAEGPASSYFARQVGASGARGEWLVFLDADVVPEPGLLDAYFDPAPAEGTAVLAGHIEDWVEEDTAVARYIRARRKLDQAVTLAHTRPYAQTANCAVRRSAFEEVGGFPDPVRSGGDADLCWRLAAAGWGLEERPSAHVRHRNRARLIDLLRQLHRHGSGMQWLQYRWPGAFPPPRPRELGGRFAALARGMRSSPGDALLDFLSLCARDLGRLRANGDPTPPRARAS